MDKLTINIRVLKNNFNYIIIFFFINILIFLGLFYIISSIDQSHRDKYYNKININLNKDNQYYKLNNLITNTYTEVSTINNNLKSIMLGFEDNVSNPHVDLNLQYDKFFKRISRSIYVDLLKQFKLSNYIFELDIFMPGSSKSEVLTSDYLEISFYSKSDLILEIESKILKIVDDNLNIMIDTLISSLEFYDNSSININNFIQKFDDTYYNKQLLGNFLVNNSNRSIINYKELLGKNIKTILKPKIELKNQFIDYNNPITNNLVTSLIFSILITLVIFFIFFVFKNLIQFK